MRLRLKGTIKSEFLEVYGNESPVYLPSANSIKCCSPPASLKANKFYGTNKLEVIKEALSWVYLIRSVKIIKQFLNEIYRK